MKRLIAKQTINYKGDIYYEGSEIPCDDKTAKLLTKIGAAKRKTIQSGKSADYRVNIDSVHGNVRK